MELGGAGHLLEQGKELYRWLLSPALLSPALLSLLYGCQEPRKVTLTVGRTASGHMGAALFSSCPLFLLVFAEGFMRVEVS